MILMDGLDEAVVGHAWRENGGEIVAVYSVQKCIAILQSHHGMSEEEAIEYFHYNVEGTLLGDQTPLWMWEATAEQIREEHAE